jgi:hypothetical protein
MNHRSKQLRPNTVYLRLEHASALGWKQRPRALRSWRSLLVQRERYVAADGDARTHTEAGGLVAISVEAGPVTVENLLHARLRDVHEQRRRERLRRVRDASHSQAT